MKIERKNKLLMFYNDDGIAYGYLLETDEGYRMTWYAGIVMTDEQLRQALKEITKFLNWTLVSQS